MTLRLIIPLLFVVLLAINFAVGKTRFEIAKDNRDHLSLAQEFLDTNQLAEAQKEFILAQNQEGLAAIVRLKSAPAETKKQIFFWEKVVAKFPHYRDVYLKLAILHYKIGNSTESKKYLENALVIDPNNEVAKKLSGLLYLP